MRLLVAWTLMVAGWVCFVAATFSPIALIAAVSFCGAAYAMMRLPDVVSTTRR